MFSFNSYNSIKHTKKRCGIADAGPGALGAPTSHLDSNLSSTIGLLVVDVDEGSLLVGGTRTTATLVGEVAYEGNDGEDGDGNTDNGTGAQLLGTGIEEGLDKVGLVLDVAAVGGLLLAELRDHGLLAVVLLNVVLHVVDVGGGVGIDVVEVDVVHADGLEESLKELVPVVNGSGGRGIVHEVRGKDTGLDGQLKLDVHGLLVFEVILVETEKLEKIGKALVVVAIGDGELAVGDGLLDLDVTGEIGDGLIC